MFFSLEPAECQVAFTMHLDPVKQTEGPCSDLKASGPWQERSQPSRSQTMKSTHLDPHRIGLAARAQPAISRSDVRGNSLDVQDGIYDTGVQYIFDSSDPGIKRRSSTKNSPKCSRLCQLLSWPCACLSRVQLLPWNHAQEYVGVVSMENLHQSWLNTLSLKSIVHSSTQ